MWLARQCSAWIVRLLLAVSSAAVPGPATQAAPPFGPATAVVGVAVLRAAQSRPPRRPKVWL